MQPDPRRPSRIRRASLTVALLAAGLSGWPLPAAGQGLVTVGEPFEIRAPFVDYNPHGLDVAMARDTGSFVVVWDENRLGPPSWLVRARRFDRSARPLDAMPLDVSLSTTSSFSLPARVASDARGPFVVAWSGTPSGAEPLSIWSRRFGPDGVPVAGESRLNGSTAASLDELSLAMAPDGQFVAAWVEWGSGVWFQKYDANAQSILAGDQPLPIEGVSPYDGFAPTVAVDPADGSFVIVRRTRLGPSPSDPACNSRWGVDMVGQRYTASGEPIGASFFVLPPQPGGYFLPRVSLAPLGNGEFVAVFAHGNCDRTLPSIPQGRIIHSDGSLSNPFVLTSETGAAPSVAADAAGNFIAAWGSSAGAYARRFDRAGTPLGAQRLVVAGAPAPRVASDSEGLAVLVWQVGREDASGAYEHHILGQLLAPESVRRVGIDIRPGTTPNTVNLGSNGVVPVAILSDPEFDATAVDPLTVTLASAQVRLRGNGTPMASIDDVNRDGLDDLVVHVSTSALALTMADATASLEGSTSSGQKIEGTDSVRIVR